VVLPPATVDRLPVWISFLRPSSPSLPEVARTVRDLLGEVPAPQLAVLDQEVRHRDGWQADGWRSLTPADVRSLVELTADPLTVGAATSMHRNGFVREAAVRVLDQLDDPRVLPWLVVRTTDWVREVRSLATTAVLRRVDPALADAFVDALPLLLGQRFEADRAAHKARAAVLAMLADAPGRAALTRAKGHPDRTVRRQAFAVLAANEPNNDLLREALRAGDVVAAAEVARAVLALPDEREECIRLLARARLAPLRATAVWEARADSALTAVVHDALYDRSAPVRRLAMQVAGFDDARLRGLYREALTRPDRREAALHGLADIGEAQDATVAPKWLAAASTRVRVAATRLLATRGGPETGDVLVDLVLDDSNRVAAEAIRGVLARGLSEAAADRFFDAAVTGSEIVRRRVFHRVLPHTSKWWRLRYGLRALRGDRALRSLGVDLVGHAVDSWNRSYTRPRPEDVQELRESFAAARPRWPRQDADLADQVASILDHTSTHRTGTTA
jgi:HEAT repeat protein